MDKKKPLNDWGLAAALEDLARRSPDPDAVWYDPRPGLPWETRVRLWKEFWSEMIAEMWESGAIYIEEEKPADADQDEDS